MKTIPDIRHIKNHQEGEYKIPGTGYRADGYSEKLQTVFEFNGDAWHGNPKLFDPEEVSFFCDKTYGELNAQTKKRAKEIEETGLKVVSIWESDWNAQKNLLKQQQLTHTNSGSSQHS